MKIVEVNIPKKENDGLGDIKMSKLGSVVVLTGKNGSGKTRIINKIENYLKKKPTLLDIEQGKIKNPTLKKKISSLENEIEKFQYRISLLEDSLTTNSGNPLKNKVELITLGNEIISRKETISSIKSSIERNIKLPMWDFIKTDKISNSYITVPFVPKDIAIVDSNELTRVQIQDFSSKVDYIGMQHLNTGTLAKIQLIQDRWFNASHPDAQTSLSEKEELKKDYYRLVEIIKTFLETDLGRNENGDATLYGFPIGKANLSEGQIIILQFCIAMYSQWKSISDVILIMDEPENHIHPKAILSIIDRLREVLTNGQLWILTHSVPIIAHFNSSDIWYVENGQITHGGKIPEKVLYSLLGNMDEQYKLQDFMSLPAQFASSRYAFDSLFDPITVYTDENDTQSLQIRGELEKICDKKVIRILDYGAGKGRIISNLMDPLINNRSELIGKIEYIAYDVNPTDAIQCQEIIRQVYGSSLNKYFNDREKLFTYYNKQSFDVVIMCNVLHEIDPNLWLRLFGKNGYLDEILKSNGFLLLIEDNFLPIGEKAFQKGFIIFNTKQLKELFQIKESDERFSWNDARNDGRLMAHLIPKKHLLRISAKSRIEALKSLANHAKDEIERIRNLEKTYHNGKLHGFWVQQFANAQLSLDELVIKE